MRGRRWARTGGSTGQHLHQVGNKGTVHTGHDNERHHGGKGGHTDEAQGVVQPQDEGAQVGAQERTDGAEDAVGQGIMTMMVSSGSSTERRMSGSA